MSFQESQRFLSEEPEGSLRAEDASKSKTPVAASTPHPTQRHVSITMDSPTSPDMQMSATQQQPPLATLLDKMADSIAAAIRQAATPTPSTAVRPIPIPEFRGLEHESASAFIDDIEEYFHTARVNDYQTQLSIIIDQLRGDAKRWFEPYRHVITSYNTFTERLRSRFDSITAVTQVTTKLYGEKQNVHENVAVFIMKKFSLFQRVDPNKAERTKTAIILDQLRPEIKSRLRGLHIPTIEALVDVASQIENDLKEIQPARPPPPPEQRRNMNPPTQAVVRQENTTEQNRPSTPCRFCKQWHFHRDCPVNPYLRGRPQTSTQAPNASGQNRGRINRTEESQQFAQQRQPSQENRSRTGENPGRHTPAQGHPATSTQETTNSQ